MPLGFERLNERTTRPNALINFIKPLPGPEAHVAEDFLNRIAAQCYPIMKRNYIAVMALEEYESNPEFLGRNFNAGEVIQLVLKSKNGSWLPFRHVQMVMMHELAHCKQMNHSRAFWAVRNVYADEMKELWSKSYVGEGLWGKGKDLTSGAFVNNPMPDTNLLPEHLCGGTYRSNRGGQKRKRGGKETSNLSYAERQQKRILRKFGAGGTALGDDEDTRVKLESGVSKKSKPRVANSKRGRELRAAAALARFDKPKDEPLKEEDEYSDMDSDTDWLTALSQVDVLPGTGFVKVCEDEDGNDEDAMRERMEMLDLAGVHGVNGPTIKNEKDDQVYPGPMIKIEDDDTTEDEMSAETKSKLDGANLQVDPVISNESMIDDDDSTEDDEPHLGKTSRQPIPTKSIPTKNLPAQDHEPPPEIQGLHCPACTMVNASDAVTCIACMNVLAPDKMPNNWRCESATCNGSYTNIGDYGRCMLCQTPRTI